MKQCPQCRNTYTDDTLRFCLADGTVLERIDEQETAVRQGVRVDVEQPRAAATHPAPQLRSGGGGNAAKIVIAVLLVGFLALVVAAGTGALFYMNSGGPEVAKSTPTPPPSPRPTATPSPTPDEQERLEKELANALKKLEEELKPDANRSTSTPSNNDVSDGRPTARVNSPNDGFLALRDAPDAETGTRIAKIPHGAVVNLENCEKQQTTIGGRTGRWCMVTYDGETGWVFDAWLQYGS